MPWRWMVWGLRDFRLLLLAQDQLDQSKDPSKEKSDGLKINTPLSLGMIWGILCGDFAHRS